MSNACINCGCSGARERWFTLASIGLRRRIGLLCADCWLRVLQACVALVRRRERREVANG